MPPALLDETTTPCSSQHLQTDVGRAPRINLVQSLKDLIDDRKKGANDKGKEKGSKRSGNKSGTEVFNLA